MKRMIYLTLCILVTTIVFSRCSNDDPEMPEEPQVDYSTYYNLYDGIVVMPIEGFSYPLKTEVIEKLTNKLWGVKEFQPILQDGTYGNTDFYKNWSHIGELVKREPMGNLEIRGDGSLIHYFWEKNYMSKYVYQEHTFRYNEFTGEFGLVNLDGTVFVGNTFIILSITDNELVIVSKYHNAFEAEEDYPALSGYIIEKLRPLNEVEAAAIRKQYKCRYDLGDMLL